MLDSSLIIKTTADTMTADCIKEIGVDSFLDIGKTPDLLMRIETLLSEFKAFVDIPRDNNCFYRTFIFSLLVNRNRPNYKERFLSKTAKFSSILEKNGYNASTMIDFIEAGEEYIARVWDPLNVPTRDIFDDVLKAEISNYLMVYLKLLIASYLLENEEIYMPFLTKHPDMITFCRCEIDPLGKHAGELEISILCTIFDMNINVYSLMRDTKMRQEYTCESSDVVVNFLYTNRHYQLLLANNLI